jgi:hypothetical protein
MATIKISGCIVYDSNDTKHKFADWLKPEYFSDEVYESCVRGLVLICPHTIEIDEPENLDLITPQLRDLDRQEADLSAKYQAAKTQIEAKRQSLLAIECAVQS